MEKIVYRFQLDCNHIGVQRTIQGLQSGEILARECVIGLVHGSTPIELPTDNSVVAAMYVTRDGVTDVKACTLDTANSTVTYAFDEGDIANAGIVTMQLKLIKTGHGGAERVLFAPKFEVEIEQSDADEGDADDSPTFTALENALAQAQSVYNERLVSVTTNSNYELVFTYADGTTYVTDVVVDAAINAVDIRWAETVDEIQGYVEAASNHEDAAARFANDSEEWATGSENSKLDSEAYAIGTRNGMDVRSGDVAFENNSKFYANVASNKADSATTSAYHASVSADNAEDSAGEAEAWANGQIGGTDVPSTHPAYHNNSKWYKEQASQIAGGEDLVKYTEQSKSKAEKLIARLNIGAESKEAEDDEYLEVTNVRDFSDGWHWVDEDSETLDYTQFPDMSPHYVSGTLMVQNGDLLFISYGRAFAGSYQGASVLPTWFELSGASIDDTTTALDKTWSSRKISTELGSKADDSDVEALEDRVNEITSEVHEIEPLEHDTSTTYAVGDLCMHEGSLYVCNTATSGAWNGSYWTKVRLGSMATLSYTVVSTF